MIQLSLPVPFVWLPPADLVSRNPYEDGDRYENPHTIDWRGREYRSDEMILAQSELHATGDWDRDGLTASENEFVGTLWGQPIGFNFSSDGFSIQNGRHRSWLALTSGVCLIAAKSWGVYDGLDGANPDLAMLQVEHCWWMERHDSVRALNKHFLTCLTSMLEL